MSRIPNFFNKKISSHFSTQSRLFSFEKFTKNSSQIFIFSLSNKLVQILESDWQIVEKICSLSAAHIAVSKSYQLRKDEQTPRSFTYQQEIFEDDELYCW